MQVSSLVERNSSAERLSSPPAALDAAAPRMSAPPSAEVPRVRTRSWSRQQDSGQKRAIDWITGKEQTDEDTESDRAGSVHGSGGSAKRHLSAELGRCARGSAGSESGSEQEHNAGGIQGPQVLVDHGETLDSYRHIQNCQWYLIGAVGMELNLGKTLHAPDLMDKMLRAYTARVQGFAEDYMRYETDEQGGGKKQAWTKNKDADWLAARLLSKSGGGHKPKQDVTGDYLWAQYKLLKAEVESELHPAWLEVTDAGTYPHKSGDGPLDVYHRWLQLAYEKGLDRKAGTNASRVKQENAAKWKSIVSADATCPLAGRGHGEACPYGRMPPNAPLPKGHMLYTHMGPLAPILGRHHKHMDTSQKGIYPPYEEDRSFQEMFGTLTSGGPPALSSDGGARVPGGRKVDGGSALSRRALALRDLESEQSCHDAQEGGSDWRAQCAQAAKDLSSTCAASKEAMSTAHTSVMHLNATPKELLDAASVVNQVFLEFFRSLKQTPSFQKDLAHRRQQLEALQTAIERDIANNGPHTAASLQSKLQQVLESEDDDAIDTFEYLFASYKGQDGWPWRK